jgi:hypothetical protein
LRSLFRGKREARRESFEYQLVARLIPPIQEIPRSPRQGGGGEVNDEERNPPEEVSSVAKYVKYRKLPVVVEATQWFKNGDHPQDGPSESEGEVVRYFRHPDVSGETSCRHCDGRMHDHGWIDTLEGGHIVCPGDWVIIGRAPLGCPIKEKIFAATYEIVERDARFTEKESAEVAEAKLKKVKILLTEANDPPALSEYNYQRTLHLIAQALATLDKEEKRHAG